MKYSTFIHAVREEEAKRKGSKLLITQGELASLWGVSRTTVTNWALMNNAIPIWRYLAAQKDYGWDDKKVIALIKADFPDWRLEELSGCSPPSNEFKYLEGQGTGPTKRASAGK